MSPTIGRKRIASTPARVLAALKELVGALDRRVPHTERPGEQLIAADSRKLRSEAVARIEDLARAASDNHVYDEALVEAIMTDDGGARAGSHVYEQAVAKSSGPAR